VSKMSGAKKQGFFYAVRRGKEPGIYRSWPECQAQVNGFNKPEFRKFPTEAEAKEFIDGGSRPTDSKSPSSLKRKLSKVEGCDDSVSIPSSNLRQWCDELHSVSSSLEALQHVLKGDIVDFDAIRSRLAAVASDLEQTSTPGIDAGGKRKFQPERAAKEAATSVNAEGLTTDKDGFVIVFTDGACEGNGKVGARAGIGVYWSADHPWNASDPVKGDKATNNAAEIQAVTKAVTTARANAVSKLKIKTDSQFVINCVTKWMSGWKRKGWKTAAGHEVINKADLMVLDKAVEDFGRSDVVLEYVPAHVGIEGNEAADRLAVLGAKKYARRQ